MSSLRSIAKAAVRATLPPVATDRLRHLKRSLALRRPFRIPGTNFALLHRGTSVDYELFDHIFLQRNYDLEFLRRYPEIRRFYDRCAQPLIVDCGVNIGASPVWFATRFPKAKVVAVEPETSNFSVLERNARAVNMRPVHGALAARSGRVAVIDPGLRSAGFRTASAEQGDDPGSVRAYTLQELVALEREATPFILKIDIEGGESELSEADHRTLDAFPVVIIELHDWMLPGSASSQPFLAWHASKGRDLVQRGENTYSLSNDFPVFRG